MWRLNPRIRTALALLAIAPAAPAHASPVAPARDATATVAMLHPLELIKRRDMDFGYVAPIAAGTVVLDPETDTVSATGGALLIGGTPHSAMFTGAAKNNAVVIIRIPKQPILVTRSGGTETMIVSKFTLQGLDRRVIAARTSFDFRVGATLNVNANQAPGVYNGTFEVEVQYP